MFAVSDVVWQALIAGAVTIVLAWVTRRTAREAANKVEGVRTDLLKERHAIDSRLDVIAATGDAVHLLVNNAMAVQLRLNASLSRRLYLLTGDAADREAAELAEAMDRDHTAKQSRVDARGGV